MSIQHHQFTFKISPRFFGFPWRQLLSGTYPSDDRPAIYFYSVVDEQDGAPAPFYIGQRIKASLLSRTGSLRHYKRWWKRYSNKEIRCDVFSIHPRHFQAHLPKQESAMKLYSIEYLTARLLQRSQRPQKPLKENRGFQFTFAWLEAGDVRSIATQISKACNHH